MKLFIYRAPLIRQLTRHFAVKGVQTNFEGIWGYDFIYTHFTNLHDVLHMHCSEDYNPDKKT